MKIDLAIYTGDVGYDWHHAGAFGRDELIAYKRIMGKFPDPDFGRMSFGGVFNEGKWLVFYRYHYAKRWDNVGRDSLYVVLGRVPLTSAAAVDFKCAFALTEMNQPMKPFPTATTYFGPRAVAAPSFASQRLFSGTNALSYIGSWFAAKPEGRLVVTIDGDYANPRLLPRFESVSRPVVPDSETRTPTFGGQASSGWMPSDGESGNSSIPLAPRSVSLAACLTLSAGLFVLGGVSGYALHGWIGKNGSLGDKISEKVTEMTGYEIKKVEPPLKPVSPPAESRPTNVVPAQDEPPQSATTNKPPIQAELDKFERKVEEVKTNVIRKVDEVRGNSEKVIEKVKKTINTLASPPAQVSNETTRAEKDSKAEDRLTVEANGKESKK